MRYALLLALTAGGSALLSASCGDPPDPPTSLSTFLEPAASAEAWRIVGDLENRDFFKYKEISGPVALSDSLRKELTKVLLDRKAVGDGVHPCIPTPGVKVRFNRPSSTPVWVFFCFECHELFLYHEGQLREHKGFDGGVAALAGLMKRIFPDDQVIRSLK